MMATKISPNVSITPDYGGFTPSNILDRTEENRLKNLFQTPNYYPVINVADEFQRRYGEEQRLVEEQARIDYENQVRAARDAEQQAMAALAQRGLGQSPYAQSLASPIREQSQYDVESAKKNLVNAAENQRAIRVNDLRNRLASDAMSAIAKQFNKAQQQFSREFSKYQNSTQSKYADELRETSVRLKDQADKAWENMELQLQRGRRGGRIIGGLGGAVAGIVVSAIAKNPKYFMPLFQAGLGTGEAVGTGVGSTRSRQYF